MPYEIKAGRGREFCVFNQDTGENKGCSDSYEKSVAHLRLIYMVEAGKRPTGKKKRRRRRG